MGPTLTGRWGGQALGRAQAGELGRKNPCSSPKPHFVLKKEERSRKKKKGRILASSLQSLVFLGNTLFISTFIEVRPI